LSSESGGVLHLITRLSDERAWNVAALGENPVIVLAHDAVMETPASVGALMGPTKATILAVERDALRRGVGARWPGVGYPELIELMVAADRVVSW
jgi:hypothetical protein